VGSWQIGQGVGAGLFKLIQQLCKPSGVPQKEPAHHCLKSRGPPIDGRIAAPWSTPGPVASPSHPVAFGGAQQWLQPLKGPGLGFGADLFDNGTMQGVAATGLPAVAQPLMQFPDRIPQPGQLQRTKFAAKWLLGLDLSQPLA